MAALEKRAQAPDEVAARDEYLTTRSSRAAMSHHAAVDSCLARRRPGILTDLDVGARGFVPLERQAGTFYAGMAGRAANLAAEPYAITIDTRDRWLAALQGGDRRRPLCRRTLHIFTWSRRLAEPRCASAPGSSSPKHSVRGGEPSATLVPP